jgi:LytS/YehU family sensor histidine kinase
MLFAACALGVAWLAALGLREWLPSIEPVIRGGAWSSMSLGAATVFFCALFLMYALDAADRGEEAARKALESDLASRDAELRALRAQVDPHFLFNCLHSISAMTSRDPAAARRMCLELADFFRASIKAGAEQRIPLADELQLVRGYLGIEQVRFGDRLRVEVDDAGEGGGTMVPPLLLQPLVENAVRHGIATLVEGGAVRVTVKSSPGRVEIVVENPFDPDGRRPGTGVGLANVRGRLETAYRGAAMIRADTAPGEPSRFTVLVSIPGEDARA